MAPFFSQENFHCLVWILLLSEVSSLGPCVICLLQEVTSTQLLQMWLYPFLCELCLTDMLITLLELIMGKLL